MSRIAVLVPEIVHSCYFALVWSTHRLLRHVADRIFIILFLRHGNHSERYTSGERLRQTLFATYLPAVPPPHNTPRPQAARLEAQHREPAGWLGDQRLRRHSH